MVKKGEEKKGSKHVIKSSAVHPQSRKATQLHRVQLRKFKLSSQKNSRRTTKVFPLLDRVTWFQMALDPSTVSLNQAQLHDLITQYINRNDETIQSFMAEQRPGRPIPKKLDELKMLKERDILEYEKEGFEVPDLEDESNVKALFAWDGTRESFNLVRIVRIRKLP